MLKGLRHTFNLAACTVGGTLALTGASSAVAIMLSAIVNVDTTPPNDLMTNSIFVGLGLAGAGLFYLGQSRKLTGLKPTSKSLSDTNLFLSSMGGFFITTGILNATMNNKPSVGIPMALAAAAAMGVGYFRGGKSEPGKPDTNPPALKL